MDVDTSVQEHRAGFGHKVLKWSLFIIELSVLCVLLIVAFLVPVPPFRWGKVPQEALLILLSMLAAISAGLLFVRDTPSSKVSVARVVSSPPFVVSITVIAIVLIPLVIGMIWR